MNKYEDSSQLHDWDWLFEKAYKHFFPDCQTFPCRTDESNSQKAGIDKIIVTENPVDIFAVDEKLRDTAYDDILLEFSSSDKLTGASRDEIGWIEKDLKIKYLVYAFKNTCMVYLIDWMLLKIAWEKHKVEWKEKYGITKAANKSVQGDYTSLSVCVSFKDLDCAYLTVKIPNTERDIEERKTITDIREKLNRGGYDKK